ncbi:hypothetical protein C0993_005971 [Termitomyces sp. T159_Od127]|nr:hypothetical protein C0993_005971 [Termitomyces sp. T159_Od127]
MSKRRRSGVKEQTSRKLQKTNQIFKGPITHKAEGGASMTPETKDKERVETEEITPKVRIGPKLILTGPNRSTAGVEDTDRGATPDIMRGEYNATRKSKDPALSPKNDSRGHVHDSGQRQQKGREVLDSVVISATNDWKGRCAMLGSRVPFETLMERLGQMEGRLCESEKRISELEVALDEKSKELDAATSFMNVTEPLSVADIISLANSFNDKVFQVAAYIAESLGFSKHRRRRHQTRTYQGEYKQASMSLGSHLLRDLLQEREDRSSECFLLQISLQVCMVTFGANVVRSWSPKDEEHRIMDQIYRRILSKGVYNCRSSFVLHTSLTSVLAETQGVAGSWRSVTQRSQGSIPTHRKEKIDALLNTIIDILKVAGYLEHDSSAFLRQFKGNINSVVDSVLKLQDAVGSITHMDILPVTVGRKSNFCPETMTNCYAAEAGDTVSKSDKVLATTELGLEQKVNNLEGSIHGTILLKPKVVLRSALLSVRKSEGKIN